MPRGRKIRIGVLFGGRSGEHEVSLRSALTIMSALDPSRYEILPIGIARDGKWSLRTDAIAQLSKAAPRLRALRRGGIEVSLPPHPGRHSLIVLGSAIGMDKDASKRLLRDAGIPVVRYCAVTRAAIEDNADFAARAAADLGYPVFVKPNALGSSIGISRVASSAELRSALDDAFQYDRKVLIEASCAGREFECAVLGNDRPEASVPGEVLVKGGHDFYSYESKYVDPEGSETRIPAAIPAALATRIREISIAAFKTLSLRGMARVDFLASRVLGEGVPLDKLVEGLIGLAIEDHRARAKLKYTYAPRAE